jgi:hypothetical protein
MIGLARLMIPWIIPPIQTGKGTERAAAAKRSARRWDCGPPLRGRRPLQQKRPTAARVATLDVKGAQSGYDYSSQRFVTRSRVQESQGHVSQSRPKTVPRVSCRVPRCILVLSRKEP